MNLRKMTKEDIDYNTVEEKPAKQYDIGQSEAKISVMTYILCAIGLIVFTVFSSLTLYDSALTYKLIPEGSWFILFLLAFFVFILGLIGEYAIVSLYRAVGKTNHKIEVNIEEVKEEITGVRTELKEEITGVRTELKEDIAEVRTGQKEDIARVRTELKEDIAEVRTGQKEDIAEVRTGQKEFEEVTKKGFRAVCKTLQLMLLGKKGDAIKVLAATEFSPLDMTELGWEMLEESGIKKYVDDHWKEWGKKLHALSLSKKHTGDLYKIQQEIFSFVEENIVATDDHSSMIEEVGSLSTLRFLARLYSRNKFFKENNWIIKEIDKYDPSKNKPDQV